MHVQLKHHHDESLNEMQRELSDSSRRGCQNLKMHHFGTCCRNKKVHAKKTTGKAVVFCLA
jgi:hypothetical protein